MLMVSDLNWAAAARLWPLLLVFIGLNIVVHQAPRPFASFLSGVVGLLAVGMFGYVLLYGVNNPLFSRFGIAVNEEVQHSEVTFAAERVETAEVEIAFGVAGANIYPLEDSNNLIEGNITYLDEEPSFETDLSHGEAFVRLAMKENEGWFWNPVNWFTLDEDDQWRIGLNPRIPTDLQLDFGTGSANLDLSQLSLTGLVLDIGTGNVEMTLPGGDYDVSYDIGTGSTTIFLPENGRHTIEIDGGTGSILLYLPDSMEARVELNQGLGGFSLENGRFEQISGDDDDGVWETADYEDATNQVNLLIDTGTGSVTIEER